MNRNCVVCGRVFSPKANNAKYCSDECRLKARAIREKELRDSSRQVYHRTCPICGKSFVTKVVNKKYCSEECSREAKRRRKKQRPKVKPVKLDPPAKETLRDICSVCGAENVTVEECKVCGFLVCAKCRDSTGTCKICATHEERPQS
jgi:predicted nucleic acid-binding Zn ribbon protein